MTKVELLKEISTESEVSPKDVEKVLSAYEKFVKEILSEEKDEKIPLPGLGTFKVKEVPERSGVSSLGDKKPWVKPAHTEICFKLTKSAREIV